MADWLTGFVEYAATLARGQVAGEEPQTESMGREASSASTLAEPPASSSPVISLDSRRKP